MPASNAGTCLSAPYAHIPRWDGRRCNNCGVGAGPVSGSKELATRKQRPSRDVLSLLPSLNSGSLLLYDRVAGQCDCSLCQQSAVHRSTSLQSEEHTSELQSLAYLVCRLLLEKK